MGIDEVSASAASAAEGQPRKAIFLDRDGTLIDVVRDEEIGAITVAFHPDQIRFLPGVIDGLRLLRDAGYVFGIATNQPAPAKGQFSRAAVERTHASLVEKLAAEGIAIEHVAVCMHHVEGGPGGDPSLKGDCECRKPKPGLLNELMTAMKIAPGDAWMIGDSSGDVDAGRAAGVRTALVFSTTRCELCPLRAGPKCAPTVHGDSFVQVARAIADGSSELTGA